MGLFNVAKPARGLKEWMARREEINGEETVLAGLSLICQLLRIAITASLKWMQLFMGLV